MKFFLPFLRQNISPFLWSIFILLLCLLPPSDFPTVNIISFDKLVHVFLYMVLVFLTILNFKKQHFYRWLKYHSNKVAIVYGLFLGIITEFLQENLGMGRTADVYDMIANAAGCGLGFLLFFLVYGKENTFRLY
jgi:VanZ family protein